MDDLQGVPCVIYAAKSTEDRKGSIPDQLRECRVALAGGSVRVVVAEYTDEAFSAFTRDRGPGLRDAMQHVEDLRERLGGSSHDRHMPSMPNGSRKGRSVAWAAAGPVASRRMGKLARV